MDKFMDKCSLQENIVQENIVPKPGAGALGFFLAGLFLIVFLLSPQQGLGAEPATLQEQLNRDISALFRHPSGQTFRQFGEKSASFSYQPPVKCATPLLRQAMQNRELLYPENRFILHRPTGFSGPDYYGSGVEVWSYSTAEGHFRIYYTEDNSHGDAVSNMDGLVDGQKATIPEYVLRFAQYFEQAWSYVTGTLGYRAPIEAGERIEVFILDMSCYGSTVADSKGLYIMVDNNYQSIHDNLEQEGKVIGAMKITAVHEFFHIVQADYDHWPTSSADNMWWEENTAVWIEDELYDGINDYLNYLGWPYKDRNDNGMWDSGEPYFDIRGDSSSTGREKGWFDYPSVSINKTGNNSPFYAFEYGGVIWAKFLSEHFGQEIVRTIFERIQNPSQDIFLAMDESIQEAGQEAGQDSGRSMASLSEAFIRFKLANLRRSPEDYEEGSTYPVPFHQESYSTYPLHIEAGSLPYLSSRYYVFHKPPAGQTLHIHFAGGAKPPMAVLAIPAASFGDSSPQFGDYHLIPLDNEQQEGDFDFSFDQNQSFTKLIVVPINLSVAATAYYTLEAVTRSNGDIQLPQNHPPLFEPVDDQGVDEGAILTFTLTATDPDGDNLTYSASNLPAGAVFNPNTREFSWGPGPGQEGSHEVTFTATDDSDTPLSSSVTVTVIVHGKSASLTDENASTNKAGCFITSCRFWVKGSL
ncbi:MAG: Ig domain-containing protein [bacterium]